MVTRKKAGEKLKRLLPNERQALEALLERLRQRFGEDLRIMGQTG